MEWQTPGKFKTVKEFRARWREIDGQFDCDMTLGGNDPLALPLERSTRKPSPNRWCIHPMEGWDANSDGTPSEWTLRRWNNFGRSGAGLIWGGEAFAVQRDGKANPNQLYLEPEADTRGGLAALFASTRAGCRETGDDPDALLFGLQLTHSGRFARPNRAPEEARIADTHPILDAKFAVPKGHPLVTDDELQVIRDRFIDSAKMAHSTGFDFVDVKCAHGYLLHELLGARDRKGPYGGSFENRTRLIREIIEGIQAACPDLEVAVRISIVDAFPHMADPETGRGRPVAWPERTPYTRGFGIDPLDHGYQYDEPFRFLALMKELDVTLINLTLASPYYAPHLQRPAAYPPSDGFLPPRDPLLEVAEHLAVVRLCKAAFPELTFVGSGYSYLQEWLPHVARHEVRAGHVDAVGLGRMVLSYPELPRDAMAGGPLARKRICRTFSDCTTGPRNGLVSGCYPLDDAYANHEHAAPLKAAKKNARQ
jgi:NADPH2 dehydrogenase